MGKVKNPERRCRICGAKCEKVMRYCKRCAADLRDIRRRVGVYYTPDKVIGVVARNVTGDIVTMNPPLSTGGYLGEMMPALNFTAPSGGAPEARKPPRHRGEMWTDGKHTQT